jgi:hypothetical protein
LHRRGVGTLTEASGNAQRRSRDHGCIGRFAVQEFRFSATSLTNYAKDPSREYVLSTEIDLNYRFGQHPPERRRNISASNSRTDGSSSTTSATLLIREPSK